jgi:phage protein D
LAKRTKSSFCVIGTKLKFVSDIFTSARVSAEYKWGKDILKFKRTVDLSEQIGKVTVTGSEPETQKVFSASVSAAEVNGTGVKLNSCVKSKEINVESPNVHNQEEARKYAESIMKQHAYALVSGFATVIGNEKLTPGSKVKFSGLDSNLNGDFYIYSVDHSYSAGGFVSKIGFGGPSA